jgi:subtilisin family serine protease
MLRLMLTALLGLSILGGCAASVSPGGTPMKLGDRQIIAVFAGSDRDRLVDISSEIAAKYQVKFTRDFPLASAGIHCAAFVVPPEIDYTRVLEAVKADPRILDAQENQTFTTATAKASAIAQLQYAAEQMHVPELHQWVDGSGVTVAVIDTGVDRDHPELRGATIDAKNFVEPRQSGGFDGDRHGTAVAGLIAARTDNEIGIAGIAPGADILAIKACWHPDTQTESARCSSWTIAQAIDHAVQSEADIINLSLAGPPDRLITRMLEQAHRQNSILVAAAGDLTGPEQAYPASLPNVIGVVGTDKRGTLKTTAWPEDNELLVAPGEEIVTLSPGGGFRLRSGSSLASSHVSGLLALLLSAGSGRSSDYVLNEVFATGERRFFSSEGRAFAVKPNGLLALQSLVPQN